jgi:hypothetical protein
MKEKSNNWLEQTYVTPEIEIIALQDEQPLMVGSKGKKPGIDPGLDPGKEEDEEIEIP